jgi:hypothetical protein
MGWPIPPHHGAQERVAVHSSLSIHRSMTRRSRLVGRPEPGSRAATLGDWSGGGGNGVRSIEIARAALASPRRSAKPITLSTRICRLSAMVSTSSALTKWLDAVTRSPFTRTSPDVTSAAAALRVRTTRACHSHLSIRWRSNHSSGLAPLLGIRFELRFQRGEFGERRIRIRHLFPPFLRVLLGEIRAIPVAIPILA